MRSIFSVLLFCACSGDKEAPAKASPLLTSGAPQVPAPIDVARAGTDPAELLRAARLRMPAAHRFSGTAKTTVSADGKALESLGEETTIETAAGGEFHARYANSRKYGREASGSSASGGIVIRPRTSP